MSPGKRETAASSAGRHRPVPNLSDFNDFERVTDALDAALERFALESKLIGPRLGSSQYQGSGMRRQKAWSGCLSRPVRQQADVARPGSGRLSPRLAYGRHRGPASDSARHAAVVILIYPHRATGVPCITLTRRPQTLSHHGGQVCLPGGRIEEGEDAIAAAFREYREELGIEIREPRVIGKLSPLYVFASDNLVDTLVATAACPLQAWDPDPVEVDQVIEMPLSALLKLGQSPLGGFPEIFAGSSHPTSVSKGSVSQGLITENIAVHRQAEGAETDLRLVAREKRRAVKGQLSNPTAELVFGYPAIEFRCLAGQRREVWGATALLLDQFSMLLAEAVEAL